MPDFVEKAIAIHGSRYDYSRVVYVGGRTKVCIVCPIHGEWWQVPYEHLRGRGCTGCRNDSFKLGISGFVRKATEIHGNKYDYSKVVYTNNRTKICIICPSHGEFSQSPDDHLQGQGCAKCALEQSISSFNFVLKQFETVHKDKYDYSKVVYENSYTKVCIICPDHGEFWQKPNSHIEGHGCKKCASNLLGALTRLSYDDFLIRAHEIHGNRYDYSKVDYKNNQTKICIVCPKHGDFMQTPQSHFSGNGCVKCGHSVSLSETNWLNSIPIVLERQKILVIDGKRYNVDGFDPITNTVYEFYGDFWHGNPQVYSPNDINDLAHKTFGELYQKTLEKEEILKRHYTVVVMWQRDCPTKGYV